MARIDNQMALLQVLLGGPSYGLALMEAVRERTEEKVSLSQGATYAALRVMDEEGLVESYIDDGAITEAGGRPRRYFKLTVAGRRAALEDRAVVARLFDLDARAPTSRRRRPASATR